jgi:hypothetical protein
MPLLLNFALEYAVMRDQINQNSLKLNGKHQFLVYVDDANKLGGSERTIKKITEASVVASKENGLEVNAENTKYMLANWAPLGYYVESYGNFLGK